ncbi:hypothetical protein GCM10022224_097750 [Nonomuraea antimicrobica]|uniref:Uncharacterized protein n=1 Tax=Nonomuraea antimicrobica TaxID=561173 RepID=A0ABP7ECS1_9ACTN
MHTPVTTTVSNTIGMILGALVNTVASLFFLFSANADWMAAALLTVGSALGGVIGGRAIEVYVRPGNVRTA